METTSSNTPIPTSPHQVESRAVSGNRVMVFVNQAVLYAGLTTLALIFAVPFYWVIIASFKTASELRQIPPTWWPQTFTLANYPEVWDARFARFFLNSFIYAGAPLLWFSSPAP